MMNKASRYLLQLLSFVSAVGSFYPNAIAAQQPFTPGVAFGAYAFPFLELEKKHQLILGVQFDLFSELSKDLDTTRASPRACGGSPSRCEFLRYNNIDRTIGYNQLGLTWVWSGKVRTVTRQHQYWASLGWVGDGVTEPLQNNFAHGLRKLTYVPRDSVAGNYLMAAGGTDQSWFTRLSVSTHRRCCYGKLTPLWGVGGAISEAYSESYLTLGLNADLGTNSSSSGGISRPLGGVGGLVRAGLVGDWFEGDHMYCGLKSSYWMMQFWSKLPSLADLLDQHWAPDVRVLYTKSYGPFADSKQDSGLMTIDPCPPVTEGPMTENFFGLRLEGFRSGWSIEMWDDAGFKDLGPTFGLRIQVLNPW